MAGDEFERTMGRVRLGARIVQWGAAIIGLAQAGPDLAAEYVTGEGASNLDMSLVVAGASVLVFGLAAFVARMTARAGGLRAAERTVEAGLGDSLVVLSVDSDGHREHRRVVSADRWADPLPLSPLADVVAERLGGGAAAWSITVFCWLFGAVIILGLAGVQHGAVPGPGEIVAMLAMTLVAAMIVGFRACTTLSSRESAIHKDLGCLGLRRRRSLPYGEIEGVTVEHRVTYADTASGTDRSNSGPMHSFKVLLVGAHADELGAYDNAFEARGRARQLAAYMGKPYIEAVVDDLDALPLMEEEP